MGVQLNEDRFGVISATINPAALAAGPSVGEQTFTVPGLKVGDLVLVQKPTLTANVQIVHSRVSAADTLAITFLCITGTPDPASEIYLIWWFRPESVDPAVVL